ncbi:MAG: PEP-CTERM sorting domain-containing protein [Kiritimatiellia bacterium]
MKSKFMIIIAAFGLASTSVQAQISLSSLNTPYTQNFDTIVADNTSGNPIVLPLGWTATGESVLYRGTSTSSTSGGLYGYNSETLGYLPSSSADNIQFTALFANNTGSAITELSISYLGEHWRGVSGRENTWSVELDTGSGFSTVSGLTFTPNTDGSLASAASLSNPSIAVSIADSATFSIRWVSDRGTGTGSSQGISFDNVSVTAIPEPSTLAMVGLVGLAALAVLRKRK